MEGEMMQKGNRVLRKGLQSSNLMAHVMPGGS